MGELKDPLIVETTSPYWVCFQRCLYWMTDESAKDVWTRRKKADTSIDSQRYPHDYPGRIVSVADGRKERPGWTRGELVDAIKMDLTPTQFAAASARHMRIDTASRALVPTTDRLDAVAQKLLTPRAEVDIVAVKASIPSVASPRAAVTQSAAPTKTGRGVFGRLRAMIRSLW